MSAGLTFYTNPKSRGQIARWMLEEIGQPYETVIVEYGKEMKTEPYRSINPMGKVPALVHGEHIVTETGAICAYLADAFPDAELGPTEAERGDYYRWLFFTAGPIEHAVTNHSFGFEPSPEQQGMAGYGTYDLAMKTLEEALSDRPYICGERFTAADVYVGSEVGWGLMFGTMPENEIFKAYAARLQKRPAYLKAQAIVQAG